MGRLWDAKLVGKTFQLMSSHLLVCVIILAIFCFVSKISTDCPIFVINIKYTFKCILVYNWTYLKSSSRQRLYWILIATVINWCNEVRQELINIRIAKPWTTNSTQITYSYAKECLYDQTNLSYRGSSCTGRIIGGWSAVIYNILWNIYENTMYVYFFLCFCFVTCINIWNYINSYYFPTLLSWRQ